MRRARIVLLTFTLATLGVAITTDGPASAPGLAASRATPVAVGTVPVDVSVGQDAWLHDQMLAALYAEWERAGRAAWDAAAAEAVAAEVARRWATRTASRPTGTTVGECTGFAIPAYIIQRESGGNPSASNPSGAYGCAQTLLSHYSRGQCQGMDPYTIQGQRDCVWELSDGGTNLDPWAATR